MIRKQPIKVSAAAKIVKPKCWGKMPKVKIPMVLVAKSSAGLRLGVNLMKPNIK